MGIGPLQGDTGSDTACSVVGYSYSYSVIHVGDSDRCNYCMIYAAVYLGAVRKVGYLLGV